MWFNRRLISLKYAKNYSDFLVMFKVYLTLNSLYTSILLLMLVIFFRGAVAADGRIEPGDMLLQVNNVNFENMSNEDAVKELRKIVHTPG